MTLKEELIMLLFIGPIAAGAIWMLFWRKRWGLLKILWIPIPLALWLIWDIATKIIPGFHAAPK